MQMGTNSIVSGYLRIFLCLQYCCRVVDIDVSLPLCEESVHCMVKCSEGSQVVECKNLRAEVPCMLEFCSSKSLSKTDFITIVEKNSGIK